MPTVKTIEAFAVSIPREVPYLGPLAPGEVVNTKGYIVRKGNRTIYPTSDMSVIVRAETADGIVGWGETYGIVAPGAVLAILREVLFPFVEGRDPRDVRQIYQDLYDMQRVRGASGGYYGDALAAIDIALWDLVAKDAGVPLYEALGGKKRDTIPAYVSGLPKATLAERVEFALEWQTKGFRGFKYAAAVSHEGVVEEMRALREALGPDVDLMVDLHWKYSAREALELCADLAPFNPYFIEAPVASEDIDGLAEVASQAPMPIAAGEEWRNVWEARMRLPRAPLAYVQPEMGHTGVSQFLEIAKLADQHRAGVIPHATIGVGIFMAASLHAAATLPHCPSHEYQHSVFNRTLEHTEATMHCVAGYFLCADGPGLGATPKSTLESFKLTI